MDEYTNLYNDNNSGNSSRNRQKAFVTMEDVGMHAGVSRQTVSRYLNEPHTVAPATRETIKKSIYELGYRPDPAGKSLASRKQKVLAFVATSFSAETYARILAGAERYAREHGFSIFVSGATYNEHGEPIDSPMINKYRVAGILIIYHGSPNDTFEIVEQLPKDIPVFTNGYGRNHARFSSLNVDNIAGARKAVEHLIHTGCERIATIQGYPRSYESIDRTRGYVAALQYAGMRVDDEIITSGDWTARSGYDATRDLLLRDPKVDAIFCQNDRMAVGSMKAIHESGLRIPNDVSVVGFDNLPITGHLSPALTTVAHPAEALGRASVKALLRQVEPDTVTHVEDDSENVSLAMELVIRETTRSSTKHIDGDGAPTPFVGLRK